MSTEFLGTALPAQVTQHQGLPCSPAHSEAGSQQGQERGVSWCLNQGQGGEWAPLTSNNYSLTRKGPVVTEEGSGGRPPGIMLTTVLI